MYIYIYIYTIIYIYIYIYIHERIQIRIPPFSAARVAVMNRKIVRASCASTSAGGDSVRFKLRSSIVIVERETSASIGRPSCIDIWKSQSPAQIFEVHTLSYQVIKAASIVRRETSASIGRLSCIKF